MSATGSRLNGRREDPTVLLDYSDSYFTVLHDCVHRQFDRMQLNNNNLNFTIEAEEYGLPKKGKTENLVQNLENMMSRRCVSCKEYKLVDLVVLFRSTALRLVTSTPSSGSLALTITASSASSTTLPWTFGIIIPTHGNSGFFRKVDDEWVTGLHFSLF